MLRAVFFDVGNTLLYPYPSVAHVVRDILLDEGHARDVAAIEGYLPLVDEFYEERYREDDSFWTDEDETSAVWVGMYSLLARELGLHADAERIARRVYDEFGDAARWRAYPDVAPALERLKARGLRLGVISNWDRRLARILDGLGLGGLFDTIISSAEVGLRKPDPRIFDVACEELGVAPGEAAHVGDHEYADLLGANSVGMAAVLIDRHGGDTPDYEPFLRSLDDLESVLAL